MRIMTSMPKTKKLKITYSIGRTTMLPVMTAVIEAMPKNRINCIEYTPSHVHIALNARAELTSAPRENRKVSSATTTFEPITAQSPPSHTEPKTASRRIGREATSPVLRLEYMKLKTAMADIIAMINATIGAAKIADSDILNTKSSYPFEPMLFISVSIGMNRNQPAKWIAHSGQKRRSVLLKSPGLKNDIFDFIVGTSQLINKYLLKRQRNKVHEQRLAR